MRVRLFIGAYRFGISDGSDHRACCSDRGVPRRCLEWCRGEPVNNKMCVLSYSKSILACFHELKGTRRSYRRVIDRYRPFINGPGTVFLLLNFADKLPGPPINVRVENTDAHTITVKWDPPAKNPQTVEVYRCETIRTITYRSTFQCTVFECRCECFSSTQWFTICDLTFLGYSGDV